MQVEAVVVGFNREDGGESDDIDRDLRGHQHRETALTLKTVAIVLLARTDDRDRPGVCRRRLLIISAVYRIRHEDGYRPIPAFQVLHCGVWVRNQ